MSNDEQTLWVGRGNGSTTLHVARQCKTLARSDPRPATENERRAFERCGMCATDTDVSKNDKFTCLKCGQKFANLGSHMRHCDGGESDE